jgi:RNA polymerase sigma-70 factor (ECF subfamily)
MSTAGTSRTLLARIRANDAEAWDRLVTLYAAFVFQTCRRSRLAPEDAADVAQEVFQAAFTRIATFEKQKPGDTFRGWLRTITRNKVNDHFRALQREPRAAGGTEIQVKLSQVPAPEPAEPPAAPRTETPEERLFHAALENIRRHFHENTWRAFHATVVDGRSPTDVGEDLGMTAGAVRVAKSRVLQRLRAELGDR